MSDLVLQYRGLIEPMDLTDGRRVPENPLAFYAVRITAETAYGDEKIQNGRIRLTLEEVDALLDHLARARKQMLEFNVKELEALLEE